MSALDRAIVKVAAQRATYLDLGVDDGGAAAGTMNASSASASADDDDDDDAGALTRLERRDATPFARAATRRGASASRARVDVATATATATRVDDDAACVAWAREALDRAGEETTRTNDDDENDDENEKARWRRDRRVVAMVVDRDGVLVDAAVNTNAENAMLHAEFNLLMPWLMRVDGDGDGDGEAAKSLPPGARLFVSLQCCAMCAALVCAASDARGGEVLTDVVYGEEDPGALARDTELRRRGWERKRDENR